MWSITGLDVISLCRTGEGRQFTECLNATIRTHAFRAGLAGSNIYDNIRTNLRDGGVDTKVNIGTGQSTQDQSGWMVPPTAWQFKATSFSNAVNFMASEVAKSYAKQCIDEGYAYRLCICDEASSEDKTLREDELNSLVRKINPQAPEARILLAGDIAAWISSFPSLIVRFFKPHLEVMALHFESWKKNAVASTPTYVPVPSWQPTFDALRMHLDLSLQVPDVVFPLQGEAGVGKTRLVHEAIASLDGACWLVLYCSDDPNATNLARAIANDEAVTAILIADECSLQARGELRRILAGHSRRARVVAIDVFGEMLRTADPEPLIRKMGMDILATVLSSNFPDVPAERQRAYVVLSEGFVRLAADMCSRDLAIAAVGHIGPVTSSVQEYITLRFPKDEDLEVLLALALVDRIGFKDDVVGELDALCSVVGLERRMVELSARRTHDIPGFIAQAGRYYYVTPEIIAQVAFDGAWRRWIDRDPTNFIDALPQLIKERFLKRVMRSAGDEVRSFVGAHFRRWANALAPEYLADIDAVDQLVMLIDTEPDRYLPTLHRLVGEASQDVLLTIVGDSTNGRWGPRRGLVWLMERMGAFSEYFDHVEAILRRLAVAETEPNIGNNATVIWRHLFRIVLSGSAVPFPDRLQRLRSILYGTSDAEQDLALSAIVGFMDSHTMRMLGPAVVAGRIPPPEWQPRTNDEHRHCQDTVVELLIELAEGTSERLMRKVIEIAIEEFQFLISYGYLVQLQRILQPTLLSETQHVKVMNGIENFIYLDCDPNREGPKPAEEYAASVKQWLGALQPTDFHGRLVVAAGTRTWHHHENDNEIIWQSELRLLAQELLTNSSALENEIAWLTSPDAESAGYLGKELGYADVNGALAARLIHEAVERKNTTLVRGYLAGLLPGYTDQADRINALVDAIETQDPRTAYNIFIVGGTQLRAFDRTVRLVRAGLLSADYFQGFLFGMDNQPLNITEFHDALGLLLTAIQSGDHKVISTAIDLVAYRQRKPELASETLNNQAVCDIIWQILTITSPHVSGTPAFWWNEIFKIVLATDPIQASELGVAILAGDNSSLQRAAQEAISQLAREHPLPFLARLRPVLLDPKQRWRIYIGRYKPLIQSVPGDIMIEWLRTLEPAAVSIIARYLSPPYLGEGGQPTVPKVTEFILSHFEGEDKIFKEFAIGIHNLQMYSGDIAAQHEEEADIARQFLNHPVRRVREWAALEEERSLRQAKEWRNQQEEDALPE